LTELSAEISGGLTPDRELVFAHRPENPDMRESTSVWLYEENGAFALPRFGIEAQASAWDNPLYQVNFAFPGGRVLSSRGRGAKASPYDPEGRATVLGAGPLTFRCVEPFRRWTTSFDGVAVDGSVEEQIAGRLDPGRLIAVSFEARLMMVTPCWVQDFTAEKVAQMSEADAIEAANMGIGWRLEHLFRGEGTLTIAGRARAFKAVGSRIKRQSVRPLAGFRGHCWQSALFPDGRAFGYIAYPPRADGVAYNEGYIYQGGRMYAARAVKIPWLRRIVGEGDEASVELESDLGITRVGGVTAPSTFRVGNPDIGGLNLQQGGVRYTWDGQSTFGMIERSSPAGQTSIG